MLRFKPTSARVRQLQCYCGSVIQVTFNGCCVTVVGQTAFMSCCLCLVVAQFNDCSVLIQPFTKMTLQKPSKYS